MEHSTSRATQRAVTRLLNDSKELEFLREECAALTWHNVELANLTAALRKALKEALDHIKDDDTMWDDDWNRLAALLTGHIETCSCGHLMTDHDQRGCCWLHCKPICGKVENDT
jgi:hypothetical protein